MATTKKTPSRQTSRSKSTTVSRKAATAKKPVGKTTAKKTSVKQTVTKKPAVKRAAKVTKKPKTLVGRIHHHIRRTLLEGGGVKVILIVAGLLVVGVVGVGAYLKFGASAATGAERGLASNSLYWDVPNDSATTALYPSIIVRDKTGKSLSQTTGETWDAYEWSANGKKKLFIVSSSNKVTKVVVTDEVGENAVVVDTPNIDYQQAGKRYARLSADGSSVAVLNQANKMITIKDTTSAKTLYTIKDTDNIGFVDMAFHTDRYELAVLGQKTIRVYAKSGSSMKVLNSTDCVMRQYYYCGMSKSSLNMNYTNNTVQFAFQEGIFQYAVDTNKVTPIYTYPRQENGQKPKYIVGSGDPTSSVDGQWVSWTNIPLKSDGNYDFNGNKIRVIRNVSTGAIREFNNCNYAQFIPDNKSVRLFCWTIDTNNAKTYFYKTVTLSTWKQEGEIQKLKNDPYSSYSVYSWQPIKDGLTYKSSPVVNNTQMASCSIVAPTSVKKGQKITVSSEIKNNSKSLTFTFVDPWRSVKATEKNYGGVLEVYKLQSNSGVEKLATGVDNPSPTIQPLETRKSTITLTLPKNLTTTDTLTVQNRDNSISNKCYVEKIKVVQ